VHALHASERRVALRMDYYRTYVRAKDYPYANSLLPNINYHYSEKYVTRTEYNELRSKFDQLEIELRDMQKRIALISNSPAQHYSMTSNAPPVLSPVPPGTARPKNCLAQMFILLSGHLRLNTACSALPLLAAMANRFHEILGEISTLMSTRTISGKWFPHPLLWKQQRRAKTCITRNHLEGVDHRRRHHHYYLPLSRCQARDRLMSHHPCMQRRTKRMFLLARHRVSAISYPCLPFHPPGRCHPINLAG
jgi:hypothetical protein